MIGGLLSGFRGGLQNFGQNPFGQYLANNAGMNMAIGGQLLNHWQNPQQPMFSPQSTFFGMAWDKQRKKDIEQRENETLTDRFLIEKFGFTKEEARAARANPEIMNYMLSPEGGPDIRNDANGVPRYVDSGEPVFPSDLSEGGGLFAGKGVDAQAFNWGIENGLWSPEEAVQIATGKVVTRPNGEQYFVAGGDLIRQSADGSQELLGPTSSSSNPQVPQTDWSLSDTQPSLPGTLLSPGKEDQNTDTSRSNRVKVNNAATAIEAELNRYEQLVSDNGLVAEPGVVKDQLAAVRRGLQLQLKELFNLGVLNGPDLDLMNEMLFDPVVGSDGSGASLGGQIYSGLTGDVGARAKASAGEIRRIVRNIRDSVNSGGARPAGGWVTAPNGARIRQLP